MTYDARTPVTTSWSGDHPGPARGPGPVRDAVPTLDELLHNPLHRDVDLDHWRHLAVGQQVASVGFWLDGIPDALHRELEARARRYGMSEPQFVVALLSTLAWRTPFAEDMEPWDDWDPDRPSLSVLRGSSDDAT